ncbi:MAG: AAA family ATPase [Nanoarchaeota archaeon]|nr:AAA family ATPase [Nanoarchaeota archaeon]
MIIAISGTAGSGKSTIAKMLAEKLGYRHYSSGDFQREIAKEKGITIEELGELEKKDPSIDRMVDDRQRTLGKKEDDFVIDGWLAPCFIPHAFKVFMDGDIKERAHRVLLREPQKYKDDKDAVDKIMLREDTNRTRWMKLYSFDFRKKENYDLVLETTGMGVQTVFDMVLKKLPKNR